jgi:hypothetical protein
MSDFNHPSTRGMAVGIGRGRNGRIFVRNMRNIASFCGGLATIFVIIASVKTEMLLDFLGVGGFDDFRIEQIS